MSGSPSSGSYTYGHTLHCHFCISITFVGLASASRGRLLFSIPARRVAPSTAGCGLAIVAPLCSCSPHVVHRRPAHNRGRADIWRAPEHDRVHRVSPRHEDGGVEPERRPRVKREPHCALDPLRRVRVHAAAHAAFPADSSAPPLSRNSLSTMAALCSWSRDPYTNVTGPASTRPLSRCTCSGRSRSSSR